MTCFFTLLHLRKAGWREAALVAAAPEGAAIPPLAEQLPSLQSYRSALAVPAVCTGPFQQEVQLLIAQRHNDIPPWVSHSASGRQEAGLPRGAGILCVRGSLNDSCPSLAKAWPN